MAPSLTALLGLVDSPPSAKCSYVVAGETAGSAELAAAARMLADDAMALRCGASPVLSTWRGRAAGGPLLSVRDRQAVEAFSRDTFGVASEPGDANLIQGFVAELLWHRLTRERPAPADGRELFHVHDLSWSAYQQGGDGLVVYEVSGGQLVFRLWEVKKHDAAAHLSRTVTRACKQLDVNALRYLAQYTGYGSTLTGPLGRLYAELVPMWLDDDPRAGIGVSIATSKAHAPKRAAFGGVTTAFPKLKPTQREGVIVVVDDFPAFAVAVRDAVWTGL